MSGRSNAGGRGSGKRTLRGVTFDGEPFAVRLSSDIAFDHGASAGIFKGESRGPGSERQLVAVKVFGQLLGPVRQELLRRELQAVSLDAVRHKRILPFIGTVSVGDQTALVSPYMENGNLINFLRSRPGCDKAKPLRQVAGAVNHLHTVAGLVHGDLKCANVLISLHGDALLADFGLSTFVEKSQTTLTTVTGIREMHTIRFAAPELLLGTDEPSIKPRSKTRETDVYAFGMLMLEAITELPPWSHLNTLAVMHKVCSGQVPSQPKLDSTFVSISKVWWNICRSCWSFQPGNRPQMESVLQLLQCSDVLPCRRLTGQQDVIRSVVYLPSGQRILSASTGGTLRIWDSLSGFAVSNRLLGADHTILGMAVSPDSRDIATASADSTIRRWDASSGAPVGRPLSAGHRRGVNCVAYSPAGTRLVSGGDDGRVRLWDAATGAAVGAPLAGHEGAVWAVVFAPDGAAVASGARDGTVRLWDARTAARTVTLRGHAGAVSSVAFMPDGKRVVSGSWDGTVCVWDVAGRQAAHTLRGHAAAVSAVAVSSSGKHIASASHDKSVRIWDAQTGELVGAPLVGHAEWVLAVSFSPDGCSIVSGAVDGAVMVWDIFERGNV